MPVTASITLLQTTLRDRQERPVPAFFGSALRKSTRRAQSMAPRAESDGSVIRIVHPGINLEQQRARATAERVRQQGEIYLMVLNDLGECDGRAAMGTVETPEA